MLCNKGCLSVDDLIDTIVCVESSLNGLEDSNGAVSTSTAELTLSNQGRRESDGVVEGEAEDFMHILAALVVEQVGLEIVSDGEERTALWSKKSQLRLDYLGWSTYSFVSRGVDAVRTSNAPVVCSIHKCRRCNDKGSTGQTQHCNSGRNGDAQGKERKCRCRLKVPHPSSDLLNPLPPPRLPAQTYGNT